MNTEQPPMWKRYAVVGAGVEQNSLSPKMHDLHFTYQNDEATMQAVDIDLADAKEKLIRMALLFDGLAVTSPLKRAIATVLPDPESPRGAVSYTTRHGASRLLAFNTVTRLSNYFHQLDNTDGGGFVNAVKEASGKPVSGVWFCLWGGCGATGNAILDTLLLDAGAGHVYPGNGERLGKNQGFDGVNFEVLVNCTPRGSGAEGSLLNPKTTLGKLKFAMDLNYDREEVNATPFCRACQKIGLPCIDGRLMLVHQGALQYKLWTGKEANIEAMKEAVGLL